MPGPTKPDYTASIGGVTQTNYEFLMNKLWSSGGQAIRTQLTGTSDQAALRTLLREHKIEVEDGVRILIVDIENAKTNGFDQAGATDDFYVLVLPPTPRRHPTEPHYKTSQAWTTAYYHAVNDSYGM